MIYMSKLTLLYAEDDDETRENYALLLKNYFHEIYTARDGIKALDLYYEKNPDILLIDISMPQLNGLDMVEIIRQKNKDIPIIILTAHSEKEKLLYAVNLKLEKYLLKPIDNKLLKSTIIELIKQIELKQTVSLGQGLSWDKIHSNLLYNEKSIKLTRKERLLMEILGSSAGKYFSQDTLIMHVWHDEIPDHTHDNKLIQLVYRLNKKIILYVSCTTLPIENSYMLGYKIYLEDKLV